MLGEVRRGKMTEEEWVKYGRSIQSLEAQLGWPSPRKQRLFAVACCRRIEHALPPDSRWRDALVVAERYADRLAKRDELAAACPKVKHTPVRRATYADLLREFAEVSVGWACHTRMRKYAGQIPHNAACAAAYAALPQDEPYVPPAESRHRRRWFAAERREVVAQISLVYEVCGNPFRPATFSPTWRTSTAVALAKTMYESGDFGAMPILADALQDADCDSEDVLTHCRDAKQIHVRGCWVVDLVLGKE
jgi:hypothetical protein